MAKDKSPVKTENPAPFATTDPWIAKVAYTSINLRPDSTHVFDQPPSSLTTRPAEKTGEIFSVMKRQAEAMGLVDDLLTGEQLEEYRSGFGRGQRHFDDQFVVAFEPGHVDRGLLNGNQGRVHVTRIGDNFANHYLLIAVGLIAKFEPKQHVSITVENGWDPWTTGQAVNDYLNSTGSTILDSHHRYAYSSSVIPGNRERSVPATLTFTRRIDGKVL